MSIESDLSSIAKSIELIASVLSKKSEPVAIPVPAVVHAPIEVPVFVPAAPVAAVPNVQPAPTQPAPVTVTTTPAVPAPAAPVTASPSSGVSSTAELVAFVMAAYKELGPIKGAKIQEVLTSIGVKNINEVPADKYDTVVAGVNALKAA